MENLQIYLIKTIENHVQLYPQCLDKLIWDESGEIQRGSSWREQLKCDASSFLLVDLTRHLYIYKATICKVDAF